MCMVVDFMKQKEMHDEAKSRAKELNEYVLNKCNNSETISSFIDDSSFQKELVKTLVESQKYND